MLTMPRCARRLREASRHCLLLTLASITAASPTLLYLHLQLCRYYCANVPESAQEWPTCMQNPPGCGQLGAACCPAELRAAGSNATEADPIGPFCYAAGEQGWLFMRKAAC